MERLFNLIDEKWIMVLRNDYATEEVSLKELFANAHLYRDLAGEIPTQNVAILRLLLAILFAVFLRQDVDGSESSLTIGEDYEGNPDDITKRAVERWAKLWEMGKFPTDVIDAYFAKWHDRFWLFHPERPFYQVAGLNKKRATFAKVNKLDSSLDQSEGKIRLFATVDQKERISLTNSEAARWLVNLYAYGDCAPKRPTRPKQTWLSRISAVYAMGSSLWQTLMMNLPMYEVYKKRPWTCQNERDLPQWEMVNSKKFGEIPHPINPMALLTLQARQIILTQATTNGDVNGLCWTGGNTFQPQNVFAEHMTLWKVNKDDPSSYEPKRNDRASLMWRDLPSLIAATEKKESEKQPGIIHWLASVRSIIGRRMVNLRCVSTFYGIQCCSLASIDESGLSFSIDLLNELGIGWRDHIRREVKTADELAECIGWMAGELKKAGGAGMSAQQAKEEFYYKIDIPFRRWLEGIDPVNSKNEEIKKWRINEYRIVRSLGKELIKKAGATAFVGRYVPKNKNSTKKKLYCSAQSYNDFCFRINKCLGGIVDEK